MRENLRKILICMLVAITLPSISYAAQSTAWEDTTSIPAVAQSLDGDNDTAIAVHDGYIYIHTDRPTTVKVFSILGQLISQETVKTGTHRLRIQSRGIYILRFGTTTRRITI
jgi:hypothetical protein